MICRILKKIKSFLVLLFRKNANQAGCHQSLSVNPLPDIDFSDRNVLVGTVRDEAQLNTYLEKCFYHVPTIQLENVKMPLEYIAIYEAKKGIERYGKISEYKTIRRKDIAYPMSKNNGNELYYLFNVEEWKTLEKPIIYREASVYKAHFTNINLLTNADTTFELFNVKSNAEFIALKALDMAFNSNNALVAIDQTHTVSRKNDKMIFYENSVPLKEFSADDYKYHPSKAVKEISEIIK